VRRLDRTVALVVVLFALAVAIESFARPLSWILAGVAGLLALSVATRAVGASGVTTGTDLGDVPDHKREALRRMTRGRDWHRKAPDAPDEPVDQIWARERARRRERA
jgi:hypothetical protein